MGDSMFDKFSKLFGRETADEDSADEGLALATAALLVQVSKADGDFSAEERIALIANLQDHFGLGETLAHEILERAEKSQEDATCLYAFTRTITNELDQQGRQAIVKLLWRVALADNHIDNFEANVLAKVSGLLGVSPRDRVTLKHEVEAEVSA